MQVLVNLARRSQIWVEVEQGMEPRWSGVTTLLTTSFTASHLS